jgi:exodeoxyribonuclease V
MKVANNITLTDKQNEAKNAALDWFHNRETNGKDPNRIFTIAGLAGTGKSTLVSVIIQEMGLDKEEVAFAAYTGMAASVLLRKGNDMASTIHKLIYDTFKVMDDFGRVVGFKFELKEKLVNERLRLLVIDEWSMVDDKMIAELRSFKIKIIALGDPGQLPPITGGNSTMENPDVFLDEIMRQALDNPIIYLSMLARQGKRIDYGTHGDTVHVVRQNELWPEMFTGADQIIAGRNATVKAINKFHRHEHLGIENPFPVVGDKVICTKNDWEHMISEESLEIYLVNGLIGNITSIENQKRAMLYKMGFKPNFLQESQFPELFVDKLPFMNPKVKEGIDEKSLWIFRKGIEESKGIQSFQFGYAITCHKSQGSEFDNLLMFEEVLNRKLHKKWLYTGITRAKEKLILVK